MNVDLESIGGDFARLLFEKAAAISELRAERAKNAKLEEENRALKEAARKSVRK